MLLMLDNYDSFPYNLVQYLQDVYKRQAMNRPMTCPR